MKKTIKIILKVSITIVCILFAIIILASGYFIIANKVTFSDVADYAQHTDADYNTGIRGAIYIPSGAYKAWQMYRDYDETEIDRDLGYAEAQILTHSCIHKL